MGLIDLKSDLAWYGKTAPGFKPNPNRRRTDYNYSGGDKGDLTVTTTVQGFSDKGATVSFRQVTSNNAFNISGQGTATMLSQLGQGSKFPIGPAGQVHEFDIARTGFSPRSRYEDTYNSLSTAGLADTYTIDSPIDDMYNKVKVRDAAYNPIGYARHPLILRGIQRDGSSDPQRFGWPNLPSLGIPRGGIVTQAERILVDAARIGKFLIRPEGLLFLAKQQGLELMNPNVETKKGTARPGRQKIYNPLSIFSNGAIHIPRKIGNYGGKIGDALGLPQTRYGDIHASRFRGEKNEFNRLVKLKKDIYESDKTIIFDDKTGPNSLMGIGRTTIRRSEFTLRDQDFFFSSGPSRVGGLPLGEGRGADDPDKFQKKRKFSIDIGDEDDLEGSNARGLIHTIEDDEHIKPKIGGDIDVDTSAYRTLSYGQIRARTKEKSTGKAPIVPFDFRTNAEWEQLQIDQQIQKDQGKLVDFNIGGIEFKAYITSLSDQISAGWQGQPDQGRAEQRFLYGGFERSVDIGFLVAAESFDEIESEWNKLRRLARLCMPTYGEAGFFASPVKVTMGGLHRATPMLLTDVSFDWDTENPWSLPGSTKAYDPETGEIERVTEEEMRSGYGYPIVTSVDCTFTYLGTKAQTKDSVIFG
jgi:hypothetical protein